MEYFTLTDILSGACPTVEIKQGEVPGYGVLEKGKTTKRVSAKKVDHYFIICKQPISLLLGQLCSYDITLQGDLLTLYLGSPSESIGGCYPATGCNIHVKGNIREVNLIAERCSILFNGVVDKLRVNALDCCIEVNKVNTLEGVVTQRFITYEDIGAKCPPYLITDEIKMIRYWSCPLKIIEHGKILDNEDILLKKVFK